MKKIKTITVGLNQPLTIADKEFKEISVREPIAADLRGISITQLQMSEGDTVIKLLERITDIHADNLARLSISDVSALGNVILGFLFPKQMNTILESIEAGGTKVKVA